VIDDWVLAIGGNHSTAGSFASSDEIDAAQLQPDGTLGPWQVAGHLPSPASQCTATSDGKTLYVIDGIYDHPDDGGQVWTATLDAHGQLSALTSLGKLPDGVFALSSEAAVRDRELLVMNSRLPADPQGDMTFTLRTPLSGAMSWTADVWQGLTFRAYAQYAFASKTAYALGGYHDPATGAVTDAYVAPIGQSGASVGPAVATTALPAPVGWGKAVAVDGWLFVVVGRAQTFGAASTAVYAAPIAKDASLGAWQTATALPMPRTNHALSLVGDYLVLTGGADSAGGDATVMIARVRFPAAN